MALPTAQDIRSYLDGYNIDSSVIRDEWIDNRISNRVVPFFKSKIGEFLSEADYTGVYSGNGKTTIILSHRNVIKINSIKYLNYPNYFANNGIDILGSITLLSKEGIIKSIYPFDKGNKNIEINYTYDQSHIEPIINEAIIAFTSELVLSHIASMTGGGQSLSVQGYNRSWGKRGKYHEIRNDFARFVRSVLSQYSTGSEGS